MQNMNWTDIKCVKMKVLLPPAPQGFTNTPREYNKFNQAYDSSSVSTRVR